MAKIEANPLTMTWNEESERHRHLHRHRRAKIVCTLGPSSSSEAVMRDLMRLGMDVARLNFSHGSHAEHARIIERLRRVAEGERRSICILQDLQGPKMRTARLKDHRPILLKAGSHVTLTPRDIPGIASLLSTTVSTLAHDVRADMGVLLDDGLIELRVLKVRGDDVECEVVNGGTIGEHKGINIPGAALSMPSLTGKDEKDLLFGLEHGVDAVAISFVRTREDVLAVRDLIGAHHANVPVIAKLEKPQAIEHLEEIFEVADGVMVARGDLGVEMPPEKVPVVQKHIIRRAAEWRKPVITATQMLESMVENPRPTRAEASDVANAILDGTDAVMLSGETASGKHPREAVGIMARIIVETEEHMGSDGNQRRRHKPNLSISETICESVAHAAEDLDMRAIGVFTATGTTARLISKYRPKARIFAFAHVPAVCNRVNLYWGVTAMPCRHAPGTDEMLRMAEDELLRIRAVASGDVMGIVAGTRQASGSTNFMRLHVVVAADDTTRSAPVTVGARRASARTRRAGAR
jgi:pyruvate kinase